MFRYDSDSGSRNMSRFGVVQHVPQSPPQIACRLCNQMFMGNRALVYHLESHMTEDGNISTRQQEIKFISHHRERNDSSTHQLQSNFAIRPSIQNCYSPVQNPAPAGHHVPTVRFDVPSPQLQSSRIRPQPTPSVQPAKQRMIEQVRSDFIKSYIDQLDKPIQETVELIALDYDDEKKLELTLRL